MLHLRYEASANWNTLKFAAAVVGMSVLSGCAVAVPLRPLATASQDSRDRDFACTASSKCPNAITSHQRSSRRSQPVGGSHIADDPPDFILKGEASMLQCAATPSSRNDLFDKRRLMAERATYCNGDHEPTHPSDRRRAD
jgi:hypothetical protein